MRIALNSKGRVEEFQKKHFGFYHKYCLVVFNVLKNPFFQKFLGWIMHREAIDEHRITDIQIRMFPLESENGNGFAGKCNSKGEIKLYPKNQEICQKYMQKIGNEQINLYIKSRARATLIHEMLHLKYRSNESKVRELTQRYLDIYSQRNNIPQSAVDKIFGLLFT